MAMDTLLSLFLFCPIIWIESMIVHVLGDRSYKRLIYAQFPLSVVVVVVRLFTLWSSKNHHQPKEKVG